MEIGFVPNPTHGQEVWFEGAAPTTFRGSFMTGKKRFVVIAYRCVACGYMESYARP
jgi:predicted nucleic-acid-binding Zn-ribbon protein